MVVNVIFDSTPEHLDYSLLEESKRKAGQSGAAPGFQQLLQRNKQPQNLVIPSVWMWTHRVTLASMQTQPWFSPRRSDCMKRQIRGLAPIIMCVSPVDYGFLYIKKKN